MLGGFEDPVVFEELIREGVVAYRFAEGEFPLGVGQLFPCEADYSGRKCERTQWLWC